MSFEVVGVGLARCTTLSSKAMGINDAGFLEVLKVETENKQRAGQPSRSITAPCLEINLGF